MVNFYKCKENCGFVALEMSAGKDNCVPADMELLKANSVDAAQEKHVPVVSVEGGMVKVKVGSAPHPMLEEHHIEWIYVKTSFGGMYCHLNPGDPPEALFHLRPDEVEEVYEHCNLHGLWKAPEPVLAADFDENTVACSAEFTAGCVNPSGS